jgi:hypothetical protein
MGTKVSAPLQAVRHAVLPKTSAPCGKAPKARYRARENERLLPVSINLMAFIHLLKIDPGQ